uniref:Disease resistance R13L4/SHOC-2-like LRR domain-containing protein n=1 Tax=Ciona savignyi TaxID=51511 RepID=H2ZBI3_CIOSA
MVDCLCNKDALKLIITSEGTLQLNYNRLEELPQHLCEVHSKLVRRIFAKRNLIKAIPANLIYENVTELYLPSNRLTMLPDLSNLQSLQSLILADNNIDKLPTSVAMLANLTMLNLRNNCLESLPSEIGKLTNLVVLDLSYNRLRKIPSSIKSCVALKKLWLTDNKLVTLPREICGMETLEEISVASNNLVFLPPDLGRQENLFYMSLSENKY